MKKIFSVKIIILLVFVFISFNIQSQNIELPNQNKNNEPDVHINVNRELDNNGNVIRYDSTYTWSWSSDGTKGMQGNIINDSIDVRFFNQFDNINQFDDPFFSLFGFSNDSLTNNNSVNSNFDVLQKQMIEMMQRQQQMMNEMFNKSPVITEPDKNNKQNIAPEKKTSGNGIDI